ncbi:hypothetical protein HMPREF0658_2020 [Hoylesella marshii DSM 16973 = JCM 13450]|uniref:Uncharacterized protein n=1 Tax=Hoylesella marshii DSM 16973 = JCM 13450 TaxID=862515 RepID=E0NV15_9BACT|nr:hypothetical protein HMPREF0658_2020 [Hoylesella marshii DSM 16973 = JCM 13450]
MQTSSDTCFLCRYISPHPLSLRQKQPAGHPNHHPLSFNSFRSWKQMGKIAVSHRHPSQTIEKHTITHHLLQTPINNLPF